MESKDIYDYFVVGSGLAGICFSEVALQNNKSIFAFGKPEQASSRVAGGVFNGVTLKRFTIVSNAQSQIDLLKPFYTQIESKLGSKFLYDIPTYRKLSSIEEQNNFIVASDRPLLQDFLSSEIVFEEYEYAPSPFGFGLMKQTGYVDTVVLLDSYIKYLKSKEIFSEDWFDHSEIQFEENYISYKGKKAKNIIFCEGFMMKNNPFFEGLPLDGTKGELLVIKAKDLKIDFLLKAGLFVLPIGNDRYKVGATYNWTDKTETPTDQAKEELLSELKEIITCDFEVIDHLAGVRPTVKDRKPLVGRHHSYSNVYLLNGLGTRGVMLAPYHAQNLFDFIEFDLPLDSGADIERVYSRGRQ